MTEKSEIVLDVKINTEEVATKLAATTKALAEHKQQQKKLKKAMEESNGTNAVAAKMYAEVTAAIEKESREVKSSTALLMAETVARIDDNASLDAQRQALNAAQKAYASLSGEEKKAADASGGLRDQIARLSDRVKEQEAAIGDARRNVGNYAMQTAEAAGKMGMFGKGLTGLVNPIKNVTVGLKAASATPFLAIVSVLITILTKLAERFRGNSAAMEQLTSVFGAFSGVGNIVNKIIDKIAEGLGWIAEKALSLAKKLGILTESMQAGIEIAKEDLAIQKERQKVALETAEAENKIAHLRADAMEKDKYSVRERLSMLQQAADLEEQIFQKNYDLAKREYELQVKKNEQSASSQEDLKKENDLKIAMLQAETALFNKRKELNSQMVQLRQQIANEIAEANAAERAMAIQQMEDLRLLAQANAATAAAVVADWQEASDKLMKMLDESEDEEDILSVDEMCRKIWGLDAEGVEYFKSLLEEGVSFADAKTMAIKDQTMRTAESYVSLAQSIMSSIESINSSMSSIETTQLNKYIEGQNKRKEVLEKRLKAGEISEQQYADDIAAIDKESERKKVEIERRQAQRVKAFGILKATIDTAGAIIGYLNDPGGIAGIVLSVLAGATGAAQIAAIAAEPLPEFATGGIIDGTSYTGDRRLVRANSREMILNPEQQTTLFDAINGGNEDGTLGFNYEAMAAACAATPAPVVVYSELEEFGQKRATYNEIARV